MIKTAGSEGPQAMTNAAILAGRHMVSRFSRRSNAMAGSTIVDDSAMIEYRADEIGGVVAYTAILCRGNMAS